MLRSETLRKEIHDGQTLHRAHSLTDMYSQQCFELCGVDGDLGSLSLEH